MTDDLQTCLETIRACRLCAGEMDRPPNPVLQASASARILVAGQAPGNLADQTSTPFNDPSGVRLRAWMGVSESEFYDPGKVAIVPIGFCFPGYDAKGGDRPPMKRCAREWRTGLLQRLERIEATLLVGGYAQAWHLGPGKPRSLTETVENWRDYARDGLWPLPHPSWRNNAWLKRNPWFEGEVLPALQASLRSLLFSP